MSGKVGIAAMRMNVCRRTRMQIQYSHQFYLIKTAGRIPLTFWPRVFVIFRTCYVVLRESQFAAKCDQYEVFRTILAALYLPHSTCRLFVKIQRMLRHRMAVETLPQSPFCNGGERHRRGYALWRAVVNSYRSEFIANPSIGGRLQCFSACESRQC